MSGVFKAVGKVFKTVVKVVKKVAPIALAVGAVVLTGGAALGVLPAVGSMVGSLGLGATLTSALTGAVTAAGYGGMLGLATGGLKGMAKGAAIGGLTGGVLGVAAPSLTQSGGLLNAGSKASIASTLPAQGPSVAGMGSLPLPGSTVGALADGVTTGAAQVGAMAGNATVGAAGGAAGAAAGGAAGAAGGATAGAASGGLLGGIASNPLAAGMVIQGIGGALSAPDETAGIKARSKLIRENYDIAGAGMLGPDAMAYLNSLPARPTPAERYAPGRGNGQWKYNADTNRIEFIENA